MQHVEVRHRRGRSRRGGETGSGVSSSGASNDLPLKLTSAPARAKLRRDRFEQHPLVRVAREQELPRHERAIVVEPAAADEERQRAGAAAQPGGFEIEEHERRRARACRR